MEQPRHPWDGPEVSMGLRLRIFYNGDYARLQAHSRQGVESLVSYCIAQ